MAEHRVSGLVAALVAGVALLGLLALGSADGAKRKSAPRIKLDRPCSLDARGVVSADGRIGNAAPTSWGSSPFLRPRGKVTATMLFVDFDDAEGGGLSTRAVRTSLVKQAKRWLGEVSYGEAQLLVAGHHSWIRMPRPSSDYWPPGGAFRPADYIADAIATADSDVDFSKTEILYIVPAPGSQIVLSPPYLSPQIYADGTTLRRFVTFGQDVYRTSANAAPARLIQATSHLFSLPYLDDPGQSGSAGQRWAGAWDPMGEPEPLTHPNAWSKRKLGWLEPGRSMLCIRRGNLTRNLTAISRGNGLRAISIGLNKRHRYVIEARRRHGLDRNICTEGVLVWLISARQGSGAGPMRVQPARPDSNDPGRRCRAFGITGALDRAPLSPGRKFRDRKRGIVVEVKRKTRKGYRVRVKRS